MAKLADNRLSDTIDYLKAVDLWLANHLEDTLRTNNLQGNSIVSDAEIGSEIISLKGQSNSLRYLQKSNNENQRRALRALLLCQQVYLSNIWTDRNPPLTPGWKDISLRHWRWRTEGEICEGIKVYALGNPKVTELADAAKTYNRSKPPHIIDYILTRESSMFPSSKSCYGQVALWLFLAGFVSQRWNKAFRPNRKIAVPETEQTFSVFGKSEWEIKWDEPESIRVQKIAQIPRGYFIWMRTDKRIGGHWMVCDGNGYGWGYNNAALDPGEGEGMVDNNHCRCKIKRQFDTYLLPEDHKSGKLLVFNPNNVCPRI